jgi:hypothetical protein
MSELCYFISIEGAEEEVTRDEAMKFWLPPDDDRTWQISVRYADV